MYPKVVRSFLRDGVVQRIGGIQTALPQLYDDVMAKLHKPKDQAA